MNFYSSVVISSSLSYISLSNFLDYSVNLLLNSSIYSFYFFWSYISIYKIVIYQNCKFIYILLPLFIREHFPNILHFLLVLFIFTLLIKIKTQFHSIFISIPFNILKAFHSKIYFSKLKFLKNTILVNSYI